VRNSGGTEVLVLLLRVSRIEPMTAKTSARVFRPAFAAGGRFGDVSP
jgi:hypothetical protein